MLGTLRKIKNTVVAHRATYRRLLLGIIRGCVYPINFRHDMRLYLGLAERAIRPLVTSAVRSGDRCYDIGAKDGYYTLALARMAARGWVCAVEADGESADRLTETLALNQHIGSKIVVEKAMIGYIVDEAAARETLDHLVLARGFEPPDFIKVDIEGAEHAFLAGAAELLARHHPRMIIETHSEPLEGHCVEFLARLGYRVRIIRQASWFRERRPLAHNQWLFAEQG
jgi:precorrin-6B methylase 2